jgi:hypothetical protein
MRFFCQWALVGISASILGIPPVGAQQVTCSSLVPVVTGGPAPPASVIQLRWLGTANYELAFGQTVVLLDATMIAARETARLAFCRKTSLTRI